jgi:hypothetical protein
VRHWRLIAFGLAAYALGLLATAPASLIDAGLEQASAGRLRLAEAQGTLWSGTGQIEMRNRTLRSGVAKSITWQVLPAYLLRGQLRCEVDLDHAAKRFPVTLSLAGIELADADISLPAAALGVGEPKLAPLGLTGEVLLHVARFSFGPSAARAAPRCNGAAQARPIRGSRPWATTNCASTAKAQRCARRCARSMARCNSTARDRGRAAAAPCSSAPRACRRRSGNNSIRCCA